MRLSLSIHIGGVIHKPITKVAVPATKRIISQLANSALTPANAAGLNVKGWKELLKLATSHT